MIADAIASSITMPSTAIKLTKWQNNDVCLYKEGFTCLNNFSVKNNRKCKCSLMFPQNNTKCSNKWAYRVFHGSLTALLTVDHYLVQPLSFSRAYPCLIPSFSPWYTPIAGIKDRIRTAKVRKNLVIKRSSHWSRYWTFPGIWYPQLDVYFHIWCGISNYIHPMITTLDDKTLKYCNIFARSHSLF